MLTAGAVGVALGGNSTLQIARAAAADDTSPPRRPRYLRLAGATLTSVTLAWRRSYDNVGVAGYNVNAGGPTFRTTQTTYTITSLACATTYGVGCHGVRRGRQRVTRGPDNRLDCRVRAASSSASSAAAATTTPAAAVGHPHPVTG